MNANIKYSVIRFLLFNVHVQKTPYGKSTTDKSHRQKSTRHSNRASSMSVSGFKLRVSGSESGFILVQFRILPIFSSGPDIVKQVRIWIRIRDWILFISSPSLGPDFIKHVRVRIRVLILPMPVSSGQMSNHRMIPYCGHLGCVSFGTYFFPPDFVPMFFSRTHKMPYRKSVSMIRIFSTVFVLLHEHICACSL